MRKEGKKRNEMKKMPQHFDKAGARDILSRELWIADLLLGGMFKAELMVCRFERKLVEGKRSLGESSARYLTG